MAVRREPKATLAVNTGIAEIYRPSSAVFVVGLDQKVGGNSSAAATLRRGFAEAKDKKAFKKAAATCVLDE